MELQTKDNRKFTNQLPKWAIGCHIGLISIFFIIGIGVFVLAAKEVSETGFGLSLLLFAIGVVFLGFSWFSYKNLRKYQDVVINIQLGENGYDSYVKDKKMDEEHHISIPYENIKYVLIGMDYRLKAKSKIHSGENYNMRTKFVPVRSAKVFIYGVDTNNEVKVTSFPHADEKSLYDWIGVFQKYRVDIYHTDKALTATPSNPEVIESIPKKHFDGTLSFVIGSEAEGLDNLFLTEEQKKVMEKSDRKNRKNGLLFTTLLSFLQLLLTCFWFPTWDIVGESFSDSSGEFVALFCTILLQFFIYIKMGHVKWYEPIRDMFILYLGIFIGLQLSSDERTSFEPAVQVYAMMTIGAFLFLYYAMKVSSWFKKLGKKLSKTGPKKDSRF
ncbi:hypothetical protein [Fredinandcohnia onubensis]|uniref:hypothetical protein n=1 Tax=Fredinandcohnia onubensis TaxID=1571209 RepID=UPI000C0BF2D6|nr:hypothetical protein [Fredinandcohnia onubensis]